ncbi:C40 family peptidase, partial [Clostridium perfringens]
LRRIFACYNGGPGYGMSVNLDTAQNNYPNNVFKYAMEFRSKGLVNSGGIKGDNETIEKAIEAGMKWVGKSPYVWGGGRTEADVIAGRFDCSSLVHYCYASAGIQLGDRSSVTTWSLLTLGKSVPKEQMKRGDLIFFDTAGRNGHVGIYLGNGKFLNDSSTKGVSIGDLNSPYWSRYFNGNVRRIIE